MHLNYANILRRVNPPVFFGKVQTLDWYLGAQEEWVRDMGIGGGRLLEVGCGPGLLTLRLNQNGIQASGVDKSPRMVTHAARAGSRLGLSRVFKLADGESLPYPDATFGHTIAASVINIADAPEQVLREMARVTKPGGTVSFFVPGEEMDQHTTAAYAAQRGLRNFSAAALLLWAKLAPKLSEAKAEELVSRVPSLNLVRMARYLGGMAYAAICVKTESHDEN
ncbi:MAG TPA: class I SAM-dependent methyltransferase [Sulfuriferula sp.]|nr:class I SAM-dependent methyltransferase [Sulfuriferula sp.]